MDEDTVHVRGGILLSPEKEGGPAICNNMEEPGGYYSKRSQSREDKCYVILLMGYPKQSNSQAGSPQFQLRAKYNCYVLQNNMYSPLQNKRNLGNYGPAQRVVVPSFFI